MAKQQWVAADGQIFDTQEEAEQWEGYSEILEILESYVSKEIAIEIMQNSRLSIILLEKQYD